MTTTPPPNERRAPLAIGLCLVALAVSTWADLGTKRWAEEALSRAREMAVPAACTPDDQGRIYMQRLRTEPIVLIDGYLEFRYAENCGAAFGMLDEAPRWLRIGLFLSAGVVAVGALMWMFVFGNGGPMFAWSVPLIVSGAIGNMVDRVSMGYVVDFIRFHIHDGWEWPTFNVADSTIAVGVALLLLDGFRRPAPAQSDAAQSDAEAAASAADAG